MNLVDFTKRLALEQNGAAIHSRDYDLGAITPGPARLTAFKSSTDAATVRLLAHRALKGPNAPVFMTFATGAELLGTKPAADLLGVSEQTGCTQVRFKSGALFRVTAADRQSLILTNEQTHEVREYIQAPDNVVVNVFAPVDLKNCEGQPAAAKFERISTRLTWGSSVGSVKLVDAYARRLGLGAAQISYVAFQAHLSTLPAKAEALNCPAD